MGHIAYYRTRRGWRRIKGFRVNSGRLSIHRLQVRFLDLIKLLRRLKSSCDQALESLKKVTMIRSSNSKRRKRSSTAAAAAAAADYKLRPYRHSNSFHAEAIADCLEFIKRSSAVGMDDDDDDDDDSSLSSAHIKESKVAS